MEQTPLFTRYDNSNMTAIERQTLLHYRDGSMRLCSFFNIGKPWPYYAPILPEELVEAGLFFTGVKDKVQCAYCRGKLYNWKKGDNAFVEHKRHFPKCPYVMLKLMEKEKSTHQFNKLSNHEESPAAVDIMQLTAVKAVVAIGYNTAMIKVALIELMKKLELTESCKSFFYDETWMNRIM